MALNWAKLVAGKKVSNEQLDHERSIKEQQRLQQQRLQEQQQDAQMNDRLIRHRQATEYLIKRDDHTKEKGYLGKNWPDIASEYNANANAMPERLPVPRDINQKALSWIETDALPSWWEEWTAKCHTIGDLKQAFCDAFVPWIWRLEKKGYYEFDTFERTLYVKPEHICCMPISERAKERERRAALPNAVRYKSMLDWVQLREKEAKAGGDVPYANLFWVTCKNITFENCLRAMDIRSETFRALDKDGEIITGFLKVNGNPRLDTTSIIWLADFRKYVPIPHLEKEKCMQAKAKAAEKERQKIADRDDDYWL